jgi:hypothetical protein
MPVIMSVLGAWSCPTTCFCTREIIQSRQWNLEDEVIRRQLIVRVRGYAAFRWASLGHQQRHDPDGGGATFFTANTAVDDLSQAEVLRDPAAWQRRLLRCSPSRSLFAGLSSSITAAWRAAASSRVFSQSPTTSGTAHTRLRAGHHDPRRAGGIGNLLPLPGRFSTPRCS